MKKSVTLALLGSLLGGALVIGVPGVTPEQQAQAFAPCNNSLTCQPANVPMLVEAGLIKIGQDGIVRTAVAVPKSAPASPWAAVDWLGGVVGAIGTAVAAWTLKIGVELALEDGTKQYGEIDAGMTTEGLPETTARVEPGYDFGPSGGVMPLNRCSDSRGTSNVDGPAGSLPVTCKGPAQFVPTNFPAAGQIPVESWKFEVQPNGEQRFSWTSAQPVSQYLRVQLWCSNRGQFYGQSAEVYLMSGTTSTTRSFTTTGSAVLQGCTGFSAGSGPIESVAVTINNGSNSTVGVGKFIVWTPKGYKDPPPLSATQKGTMERTLDCIDPAGVVQSVSNASTGLMGNGGLSLAPLKCPPGTLPIDTGTTWKPETGEPITIVPKRVVIPKPITEMQKYPDCWDGKCLMTLERTDGTSCGRIAESCPDWSRDPNRSQNYVCKFGARAVNLNMCSMYRAPEYGVLPNVGTDGEYLDPSAPVPKNIGKVVTKVDGAPIAEVPGGQPMKNCRPESFLQLLNPFWVFQAVQCAITEQFVPREAIVQTHLQRIKSKWDSAPPARMIAAINGLSFTPPGSGCSGIVSSMGFMPEPARPPDLRLFNACPGEMLEVPAALVKVLIALMCLWACTMSILSSVSGVVNYRGGID